MVKRQSTNPSSQVYPDFGGALGRFAEALAIIRMVAQALDAREMGTESSALGTGLAALDQVYAELDLALIQQPTPEG